MQDQDWNDETFRQEYWAVHALKKPDGTPLENFTEHPEPGSKEWMQGSHRIQTNTSESRATMAEIDSQRVAEHFQLHNSLLAWLLWTAKRPLPEIVNQDMDAFFEKQLGGTYQSRQAVQLVGNEMRNLLEKKSVALY